MLPLQASAFRKSIVGFFDRVSVSVGMIVDSLESLKIFEGGRCLLTETPGDILPRFYSNFYFLYGVAEPKLSECFVFPSNSCTRNIGSIMIIFLNELLKQRCPGSPTKISLLIVWLANCLYAQICTVQRTENCDHILLLHNIGKQ